MPAVSAARSMEIRPCWYQWMAGGFLFFFGIDLLIRKSCRARAKALTQRSISYSRHFATPNSTPSLNSVSQAAASCGRVSESVRTQITATNAAFQVRNSPSSMTMAICCVLARCYEVRSHRGLSAAGLISRKLGPVSTCPCLHRSAKLC